MFKIIIKSSKPVSFVWKNCYFNTLEEAKKQANFLMRYGSYTSFMIIGE